MKIDAHKRREVNYDYTEGNLRYHAEEVFKKLKSYEMDFVILIASGCKNVQMLEESLKMLNTFARVEYMKTGKDNNGPFVRLKLKREEFFFIKYAEKKKQAE